MATRQVGYLATTYQVNRAAAVSGFAASKQKQRRRTKEGKGVQQVETKLWKKQDKSHNQFGDILDI